MPLNNFYTYQLLESNDQSLRFSISIDTNHEVYKGHFPGQPVTPGVILLEMVRNILSQHFNKDLMMVQAKEIKFLAPVIPTETSTLELEISYEEKQSGYGVNCKFTGSEKVFTKIKAEFSAK